MKAAFREALAEAAAEGGLCGRCCHACRLKGHEHDDHHQFVGGLMEARQSSMRILWRVVWTTGGGFLVWAVWEGVRLKMSGS